MKGTSGVVQTEVSTLSLLFPSLYVFGPMINFNEFTFPSVK